MNRITSARMPIDLGTIHLVGIGGIGMSGIAEILHNLGYKVSGSDVVENANVSRLRNMGVTIYVGQKANNVKDAAVVVKSTAVTMTNPEIIAAREENIPVVKRSEMLAELTRLKSTIAVAGSHGKTTTTSLVGHILEAANLQPTVINGGIINAYGTNAHLGGGDWLVAEADESDGTFIRIPATVGIITNIDAEHMEYWGTYDRLMDGFRTFIDNLPFYGFAALCYDHDNVRNLGESILDRRIISYGVEHKESDICAYNIKGNIGSSVFDVKISARINNGKEKILNAVELNASGLHNVQNSLAAIAIAQEMRLEDDIIYDALKNFSGVKRRFTKTGEVNGISIIDDYAHHPVEIKATLSAARSVVQNSGGKVIAVMQPHRYSRLENLFTEFCQCFGDADKVIITDIYAAGEQAIKGVGQSEFVTALQNNDVDAQALADHTELATKIKKIANDGDIVVCMGAGSISNWANDLPVEINKL